MENKKSSNLMGKIIRTIIIIILLLVVGFTGIILYKANKNPDKVPDIFGIKPFIVLSGSMETSIYTGDLVFVKVVDTNELKPNDIIAFRNEENTVTTHRIVEIVKENGKTKFRTKGDNNESEDNLLVTSEKIEGKYIKRFPGVGKILIFLQQPMVLLIVILIILVVGLLWLHILNRIEDKKIDKIDEQERQEFEEFKKQKMKKE